MDSTNNLMSITKGPVAQLLPRPMRLALSATKRRYVNRRFRNLYRKYRNYTMTPESTYIKTLWIAHSRRHVDGCVVECGVWRGGMIAGIAELLGPARQYLLFDSFAGLPRAREIDGPALLGWQKDVDGGHYHNNCTASESEADAAMRMSGATSYSLQKGWFQDTLANFTPPCPIAILRLDGDLYDSMQCCLAHLWPYTAQDGVVIIDDYDIWDGCARAVHEFLARQSSEHKPARLRQFDNGVHLLSR